MGRYTSDERKTERNVKSVRGQRIVVCDVPRLSVGYEMIDTFTHR